MIARAAAILWLLAGLAVSGHAADTALEIIYLSRADDPAYVIQRSYTGLKLREQRSPIAGAEAAIKEARIPGRAAGLSFILQPIKLQPAEDATTRVREIAGNTSKIFLLDLDLEDMRALGHAFGNDPAITLFNIRQGDDSLRGADCSAALFHTIASDAMLADALAQHLAALGWQKILVLSSARPDDRARADAFLHAARKFGLSVIDEREFTDTNDPREREKNNPRLLTANADYDVIFLADTVGEFGRYLEYATYLPRPVVGAEGLIPDSWHWTWERNGAPQLNQRIRKISGSDPSSTEWAAWAAIHATVQAAIDAGSVDPQKIRQRFHADEFAIDMYKVGPGSFRRWDNQLRQPILLHTNNAVIGVAPFDGFMHRFNVFDTLGIDEPETKCAMP